MDANREKWIPRTGTGTILWQLWNNLVAVGDDGANRIELNNQGSGKVPVTIAGRDGFGRRGEERLMAVGNDGDDIVLYRQASEEGFRPSLALSLPSCPYGNSFDRKRPID